MDDLSKNAITLRTLQPQPVNVLDDFNREGLGIEVDLSLPTICVIRALEQIIEERGKPSVIRCDNGPEYIRRTTNVGRKAGNTDRTYPTWQAAAERVFVLGRRYVQYINSTYRRNGTLWDSRYKSLLIQAETYLLICQRYIELNPVRAAMVDDPAYS